MKNELVSFIALLIFVIESACAIDENFITETLWWKLLEYVTEKASSFNRIFHFEAGFCENYSFEINKEIDH